jgi:hypothetical protein
MVEYTIVPERTRGVFHGSEIRTALDGRTPIRQRFVC